MRQALGTKFAARPPEGGPTEVGGLSASNLPLIDTPSDTNARQPSKNILIGVGFFLVGFEFGLVEDYLWLRDLREHGIMDGC